MKLEVTHARLALANEFVAAHHRHSRPDVGCLFVLAAWAGPLDLRGVAIVGRPKARALDDGHTVEVTRVATDGTHNACSQLYGAACREARRRGYKRVSHLHARHRDRRECQGVRLRPHRPRQGPPVGHAEPTPQPA